MFRDRFWITLFHGSRRDRSRKRPGPCRNWRDSSTAQRVVGDTIADVAISALRDGDLLLLRQGASVPADGIVRSGKSDVNESMITGESVPVDKTEGGKVIAGTVNGAGSLRVEVTATGDRTALANIMRLVEQGADVALPHSSAG